MLVVELYLITVKMLSRFCPPKRVMFPRHEDVAGR